MRILVVEDEPELAEAVVEVLADEYHAVDHAADGARATDLMQLNSYDLVVLDWKIPPPTGIELLKTWRAEGRNIPVLMLTGDRTSIRDRVEGLDIGADDYLTKPFAFAEFRARVRSLLRRRETIVQSRLRAGDVILDRTARHVVMNDEPLPLSPKEFSLLEYLMTRRDQVVTRTELSEHVWDDAFDPTSNVIDVLIHRLRRKIDNGADGRLLHTVPGSGYVLRSERSGP